MWLISLLHPEDGMVTIQLVGAPNDIYDELIIYFLYTNLSMQI